MNDEFEYEQSSFRAKLKRIGIGALFIIFVTGCAAAIIIFSSPSIHLSPL